MSRVGKLPIAVPKGVDVTTGPDSITVKGSLGTLVRPLSPLVSVKHEDGKIMFAPTNDTPEADAMSGTMRALVNNMVTGVSMGFSVNLEITGVGYRAQVQGDTLNLQLGYSHDIPFPIPGDVRITCERPTIISVSGADRQRVGQIAADIRAYRPPEPYKGKGIRYATENVRRKEGKKK